MKKTLSLVLALAMTLTTAVAAQSAAYEFPDLPGDDHWSTDALVTAVDNALLEGTEQSLLEPKSLLTRAQMGAIMVRAFGAENRTDISQYQDMVEEAWHYVEVSQAVQMGVMEGADSYILPNDPITREQVFAVLARAFIVADGNDETLDFFHDGGTTSDWAMSEVAGMIEGGYVHGDPRGLRPTDYITREEFVTLMYRLVSSYIDEAGDYSQLPDGTIVIRTPGVTLSNVTITGNLILADGVDAGDIVLDNVTIEGDLLIRGGGGGDEAGVTLVNGTTVDSIKVSKVVGDVKVVVDEASTVGTVHVTNGTEDVTLEGTVDTLVLDYGTTVNAVNTKIETVNILKPDGIVILGEQTTTGTITIDKDATNVQVVVKEGATVDGLTVNGQGATVEMEKDATMGDMDINANDVTASGDGVIKDVDVAENVTGTVVDDKPTSGGSDSHLNNPTAPPTPSPALSGAVSGLAFNVVADRTYTATAVSTPLNSTVILTGASGSITGGSISGTYPSGTVFTPNGTQRGSFNLGQSYTMAEFLGMVSSTSDTTLNVDTLENLVDSYYRLSANEKLTALTNRGITIVAAGAVEAGTGTYTVSVAGKLTCPGYSGSVPYTVAFTCGVYSF